MSTVVALDPLRDIRHRDARLARDQADWLAWLELGGLRSRTLRDYEWATARLLRAYPDKTLDHITPSDIAHVLRSFPPAGRRTKKAAYDSFFKWARKTRRLPDNPMEELPQIQRTPQRVIDVFTPAEIATLTSLHERAHAQARRVEAELRHPCGTVQAYKRGCRCDACRRGNRDYQRARAAG